MTAGPARHLRVPLHPALLFFSVLILGSALGFVWPLPIPTGARDPVRACAAASWAASLVVGAWAFRTLGRHGTSADFGQAVATLVEEGPYRFSRNPLYLSLCLFLLGLALALHDGWLVLGVPALALSLDRLVIAREEPFLRELFGGRYADYCRRVRRWL